ALIKVAGDKPDDVQAVAQMYGGDAVDASKDAVTVEITGSKPKIDAAIEAFRQFEVLEIVRTGAAALERGSKTMGSTTMESDN
ncbi:MAG: acetolactate synthase small subunit, partial [Halapricum sp.]